MRSKEHLEPELPAHRPKSHAVSLHTSADSPPTWGWSFEIGHYLDPFIPPCQTSKLPPLLAHFLGHRTRPQQPIGNLVVCAWTFVGVLAGVCIVEVVNAHIAAFHVHGKSYTIGSFGASAVLQFYAIESPLAQPRNAVFGKLLSSIVGVSVGKLFALSSPGTFESVRWAAGALSCAIATTLMAFTGTVHPPAGATALIAIMDENLFALGWNFVPAVLLDVLLMQCVALIVDNMQRQFPIYWWTPEEVGQFWKRRENKNRSFVEKADDDPGIKALDALALEAGRAEHYAPDDTGDDSEPALEELTEEKIVISKTDVRVPETLYLAPEEKILLESLSRRL